MKFNRSHFTNGLLLKILKASQIAIESNSVTIQNRFYEPILHVKKVSHKDGNKFLIVDNNGNNIGLELITAVNRNKNLEPLSKVREFIANRILYNFQLGGVI